MSVDVFQFEFSSIYDKNNSLKYEVATTNRNDMELFLKQHHFHPSAIETVKVIPYDEYDGFEKHKLQHFKFKSNKRPGETFYIVSSEQFVMEAVEEAGTKLGDSLTFGVAGIREDIEIIKIINDLIDMLPMCAILDHQLIDGDTGDPLSSSYSKHVQKFIKDYYDDNYFCDAYSMDCVFDLLFDKYSLALMDNNPQPITLEMYVKYFSSMMCDKYD